MSMLIVALSVILTLNISNLAMFLSMAWLKRGQSSVPFPILVFQIDSKASVYGEWCERGDAALRRGGEVVDDGGEGGGATTVWAWGQENEEREEVQGIVRQRSAEEREDDRAHQGQGRSSKVHSLASPFQAHLNDSSILFSLFLMLNPLFQLFLSSPTCILGFWTHWPGDPYIYYHYHFLLNSYFFVSLHFVAADCNCVMLCLVLSKQDTCFIDADISKKCGEAFALDLSSNRGRKHSFGAVVLKVQFCTKPFEFSI
ncbi:hypothetical protein VNO77_11652 [Canavalia gladiata]|uniref:Uncharacterized protein n=1 Tax=Canavalia gladiata TaxID=3824 RepID=A0AAN9MIA9_CANGL